MLLTEPKKHTYYDISDIKNYLVQNSSFIRTKIDKCFHDWFVNRAYSNNKTLHKLFPQDEMWNEEDRETDFGKMCEILYEKFGDEIHILYSW